jgi:hypothetical protein
MVKIRVNVKGKIKEYALLVKVHPCFSEEIGYRYDDNSYYLMTNPETADNPEKFKAFLGWARKTIEEMETKAAEAKQGPFGKLMG